MKMKKKAEKKIVSESLHQALLMIFVGAVLLFLAFKTVFG